MMRKIALLTVLFSLALLYSFVDLEDNTTRSSSVSGSELYKNNCASCHGADLSGKPPTFPSLVDIEKRMSKEDVMTLLETGRKVMPSFSMLSKQEREAIAGFLYGEKTTASVETQLTPLEKGKQLFVANCASCHKLQPDDPTPLGRQDWGRTPVDLASINTWVSKESFNKILNMGPCYMPSFSYLSSKEKNSIYQFLSIVKKEERKVNRQSNRSCGGQCRCWNN